MASEVFFRLPRLALPAALLLLAACSSTEPDPPPPAPPPPLACDRACLDTLAGQFLDALAARNPLMAPIATDFRYTQNGVRLDEGDGLWRTINAWGDYSLMVADAERGHLALLVKVRENDKPAMLAVHLTVRNRRLTGAEVMIHRDAKSVAGFASLGWTLDDPLPEQARAPRETLMRVADRYFSGLQRNDGEGDYPFAEDCERVENGARVTNVPPRPGEQRADPATAETLSPQWNCLEQFRSGLLYHISRVRDRRVVAVDVERGLVFAMVFHDHSAGDTRRFRTRGGRDVTAGPAEPVSWQVATVFRIEGGRIRRVVTLSEPAPYGMNSGWSSWEDGLSGRLRDAAVPAPPPQAAAPRA